MLSRTYLQTNLSQMNQMNQLLVLALLALFLGACSPTNNLTMGTTEPAPVVLSPEIKRIGLINRSIPSEANQKADQIDRILSVEGMRLDEDGAQTALIALKNSLLDQGIADEVIILQPR